MGATYSATRNGHTPSLTLPNYAIEADAVGDYASIIAIGWGGSGTTSDGYITRWVRGTIASVGGTPIVAQQHSPGAQVAQCQFAHTFATAPTDPGVTLGLHIQNWNGHGGLGYLALPIAAPWFILNGNITDMNVLCQNDDGEGASLSSYSGTWTE